MVSLRVLNPGKFMDLDAIGQFGLAFTVLLQCSSCYFFFSSLFDQTQLSTSHLHLHVLSADLCSPKMKHKKHYNSFHPKLGFFLHIEDVMSWFENDPSYYDEASFFRIVKRQYSYYLQPQMSKLDEKSYEKLLKEDLVCWKCDLPMKNMPTLKDHLQEEWDKESQREKARADRKRKLEEKEKQPKIAISTSASVDIDQAEHTDKKVKTSD